MFKNKAINQFGLTFVSRIVSVICGVGFVAAVTKILSVADAGKFFLYTNLLAILVVVGRGGYDLSVMKLAGFRIQSGGDQVNIGRGLMRYGLIRVGLWSVILTGVCFFVWESVVAIFFKEELYNKAALFFIASIIPYVFITYCSGAIKAASRSVFSTLTESALHSVLVAAMFYFFSRIEALSLFNASLIMFVGISVSSVLVVFLFNKDTAKFSGLDNNIKREVDKTAVSLLPQTALSIANQWAPVILLGFVGDEANVAILNVAMKIASSITLVLIVANTVVPSKIAFLVKSKKYDKLESLLIKYSSLTTALISPWFVFIWLFGAEVMGFFGDAYKGYGNVLLLISFGQMVSVACGSSGIVLIMSGNERLLKMVHTAVLCITLSLCPFFVKAFGLWGGAVFLIMPVVLTNLTASFLVYKYTCSRTLATIFLPKKVKSFD